MIGCACAYLLNFQITVVFYCVVSLFLIFGYCIVSTFSYFSPLLKSVANKADVDYVMIEEDLEERELFIETLESRFLFLAADARATLRLVFVISFLPCFILQTMVQALLGYRPVLKLKFSFITMGSNVLRWIID